MNNWKDNFRSYTMRTNFHLGLTRPQMEFLCAVADDVQWDRFTYGMGSGPHNFIASSGALAKRGLIVEKKTQDKWEGKNVYEIKSRWVLTDAGWLVVELLKITGLFIQSDNAIERKAANKVAAMTKVKEQAVLVTTEFRGVFFGYMTEMPKDGSVTLKRAQNCVYWSADVKGFLGLASTGPTKSCGDGYGDGYGDGSRSGSGDGYGYDKGYLQAVADGAAGDRVATLRADGAVIAFWRSGKDGKPCNGGSGPPRTIGTVEEDDMRNGPCEKGALHATMKPTAWKGERLWVVALYPPVTVVDDDKFAAKKREILAEIVPNFLA